MNYEEANEYVTKIPWKVSPCFAESEGRCWCAVIESVEEVQDDNGNEIIIVTAGSINKKFANHIVQLHNEWVETLQEE